MLRNYIKIALRNLSHHKGYSFINIAGLALGLMCFALILLYVQDEWSYDRFHTESENIYRLTADFEVTEGIQYFAQTPPIWATLMLEEYPEVLDAVRVKPPRQTWMVRYRDQNYSEKGWAFADSSLFDVFNIDLLQGNPETALVAPERVIISASAARKYFGNQDPMGKVLTLDNQYDLEVTGVFEDMPTNSHFRMDFFASFTSLGDPQRYYLFDALAASGPQVHFPFVYTYVRVAEGADLEALAAKFPDFIETFIPEQIRANGEVTIGLQPLTDIHLHSTRPDEIQANGDISTIYIFLAIAVFLLLIACVNFMNLATAKSASRAKEVGLRKVFGAFRVNLAQQFLGESVLLALVGLLISFALVVAALPTFNDLTGKSLSFFSLLSPAFLLVIVTVTLVVGVVAGSYPAFFLSAFKPVAVLRSSSKNGSGGNGMLRKSLIVFQFGISMVLLISTGIVFNQMEYARTMKLGLDKEHVVVFQITDPNPMGRYPAYREALLQNPNILNVSGSISMPSGLVNQGIIRPVEAPAEESWQVDLYFTQYDFVETLGMEMLAGRSFSRDFPSDTLGAFIINETAARSFGWSNVEDAVGRELQFPGGPNAGQIIGVVNDFHSKSAHEQIAPMVMAYGSFSFFGFARITPHDIPATIEAMRTTWEQLIPGYLFDYSFLDENFDQLYKREAILGELLTYFAMLTIFIACMGLFGLASFTAEQRTKEIGVRKVLGATVPELVMLLSREVTVLVLIAFVLAAPLSYFAMSRWLQAFAYHTNIGVGIFLLAGISALLIAWLTVSYQSIKAAIADPVRALRYE